MKIDKKTNFDKAFISFRYCSGYGSFLNSLEYEIKLYLDHFENTKPFKRFYIISLRTFQIKRETKNKLLYLPSYRKKILITDECYDNLYSRLKEINIGNIYERNKVWFDASSIIFTENDHGHLVSYTISKINCKDDDYIKFFNLYNDIKKIVNADNFIEKIRVIFKNKAEKL